MGLMLGGKTLKECRMEERITGSSCRSGVTYIYPVLKKRIVSPWIERLQGHLLTS